MGPNEVQALIGQWVDLVGNGKDRERREHERARERQLSRGDYDKYGYQQPPSWGQQSPYQPYQVQPYQPYQPYQAQPPSYSPSYSPSYPQSLPASTYRQPLAVVRDHRGQGPVVRDQGQGLSWSGVARTLMPWSSWIGAEGPPDMEVAAFPPRAAVVDAPLPTQANRDILPMSTSVPILPTQSAQITGRPQTLVFKIGRFVISNAGTSGGSADWIVNDIKIGNVSQFVQSGDVPGDMFATNAIDTFVRFAPAQTAMDVVVVVTYIGLNESGCPFFGAMVGTAAV
jgi:hypothetical protein